MSTTGKRIGISLILLIAFTLLFFLACALVMFLAPGTEIFGVRYVSALVGNYEEKVAIGSFSGDVYIETQNVPITIEFSDYYSTSLDFCQNFTGFTKTKIDKAGIEYRIENNDLKIKTTEFIKFIYAREDYESYHFVLRLPASAFTTSGRSIYITADQSPVKVNGTPKMSIFNVNTSGALTVDGKVTTNNLVLKLGKPLEIGDNFDVNNIDITTKGAAYVNITKEISGDLKLNTRGGDVRFVSCNKLYAETASGAIRGYGENGANVKYNVEIKTRSGAIELNEINTASSLMVCKAKIESKSGKIKINKVVDIEAVSDSGQIFIKEARNATITNRIGLVEVVNASGDLNINNTNGSVTAGANGSLNNVKVESNSGIVKVYNTNGNVDIRSNYNNVVFRNHSSRKINLYAGKKLTAEKLKGDVVAYANGNVTLRFDEISGNVSVEVGSKSKVVDIDARCSQYSTVSYILRSTKGERAKIYAGDNLVADSSTISNVDSGYVINAKSVYAKINLYFSK